MRKMGPNNARHVIQAIGEYFFKFIHVFLTLTSTTYVIGRPVVM